MSPKKKSVAALTLVALLACALLPAAASAATGRTVAVTANATVKLPNDTAKIGLGVKRERKTRSAALSETAKGLRKVIATVQAFPGVGEGDIRTGRINVRPVQKGKVTVYRATEGISVTLHEPSKAGELISKGLGAGATGVSGPSFSVGNREEAFGKALSAAFTKAKERATILAGQAGAKLGQALTIEEGEGQIVAPRNGEFEGNFYAEEEVGEIEEKTPAPTKPGTSTVSATVHVIFELT
ncbi:MAG TPA: SIMPL domain-containing protein [Solirubrobacterales bacterium]|nr:SIMPL domain-containing protein [Solirubrobacterales bacterium]